ncbi:hypothetical protein GCM10023191_029920 [Actinoallomurus oryzae]|jgi:hypothetical protein|uniref:Uncharacterized protein n=1 Tax=Actinoallomurus oryzae TaxID=502180 RepID=A0ABP8PTS9_9ACTN
MAGFGEGGRRVPLRPSLVIRGCGYGSAAGVIGGGLVGAGLGVIAGPTGIVIGAVAGVVIGTAVGLVAGLVCGVAFAVGAPCLVRHPRAVRPSGAAVSPGIFLLAWVVCLRWYPDGAIGLLTDGAALCFFMVVMAVGVVAGALTAPSVLYGKQPPSGGGVPGHGDPPCDPGSEGADSPG